ncbi:hypothetical protein OTU49_005199, partial [Cherax quadricarinatus]
CRYISSDHFSGDTVMDPCRGRTMVLLREREKPSTPRRWIPRLDPSLPGDEGRGASGIRPCGSPPTATASKSRTRRRLVASPSLWPQGRRKDSRWGADGSLRRDPPGCC